MCSIVRNIDEGGFHKSGIYLNIVTIILNVIFRVFIKLLRRFSSKIWSLTNIYSQIWWFLHIWICIGNVNLQIISRLNFGWGICRDAKIWKTDVKIHSKTHFLARFFIAFTAFCQNNILIGLLFFEYL